MSCAFSKSSSRRRFTFLCPILVGAAMVAGGVTQAEATLTTFAQFTNSGVNNFQYTNNGTSASFQNSVAGGSPITFDFSNIAGLPADLFGDQAAKLTLAVSTTSQAQNFGGFLVETLNQTSSIIITRNSAAAEGNGGRTLLLRVDFTVSTISGNSGGSSATLSSTGNNTNLQVTFSSDFLDFSATTQRDFGLSFSSVLPNLSQNANGFLNNFTAAGTGTFSSDPVPALVPETASLLPLGALLGVVGGLELRRRNRRQRPA